MTAHRLLAVLRAALVPPVAALALAASAAAAPDTVYCVNGLSTTLPTSVTASSVTGNPRTLAVPFRESSATTAIQLHGGVAYAGYIGANQNWYVLYSPELFEPGYAQILVSVGACTEAAGVAAPPPVTHVGVCKLLERADGTTGLFQQITVPDWNNPDGRYFDAPAANWVEGWGSRATVPSSSATGRRGTGPPGVASAPLTTM